MNVVAEWDGKFVVRGAWAVRVTFFVIGTNTTVVISALAATWMRIAFVWAITERVVVIYYRRFGTTYRCRLQGSRILDPCLTFRRITSTIVDIPHG